LQCGQKHSNYSPDEEGRRKKFSETLKDKKKENFAGMKNTNCYSVLNNSINGEETLQSNSV
jgi:hypothetical protein